MEGVGFGVSALVWPVSREESRAVVRRLYDGVITTGKPEDVDVVGEEYLQNSGWTPDGRDAFASALAISRGATPDGRALQTHMVAENNRLASRSVWDGTIAGSGRAADFTLAAEVLAANANRTPRRAALFYATDDESAATTAERLIRAAGFDPVKAGGLADAGRIEAPGGDLHQLGFDGEVVDLDQARAAVNDAHP